MTARDIDVYVTAVDVADLVSTRTFGGTARNAHSTSDGDGRR